MIVHTTAVARFLAAPTEANRNAVVDEHAYLCRRAARKFMRATIEKADLLQVAAVGLIKAANRYRNERKTPFDGYAWPMILGELMHYVRDHERIVRVPRPLRALDIRYATTWEQLAAANGREPSATDLAEAIGVDRRTIGELQSIRRGNRNFDSDGSEGSRSLRIDSLRTADVDLSIEDRLTVVFAVEQLAARERYVVLGIYAGGMGQKELAQTLGLSQSQVSKLLKRALEKLASNVA